MLRTIVYAFVAVLVLAAISIQWLGDDEEVVLVGWGQSEGFGGTEYVAMLEEKMGPIEDTIHDCYDAINAFDQELTGTFTRCDNTSWQTHLERAKSMGVNYQMNSILNPSFDGEVYEVSVITTVTSPVTAIKKPSRTTAICLVEDGDGQWRILNPADMF